MVAKECELPGALAIGAGAGSSRLIGVNCEVRLRNVSNFSNAPCSLFDFSVGAKCEDCIQHRQWSESVHVFQSF